MPNRKRERESRVRGTIVVVEIA
jgi:hypothetical protein